MPINVFGNSSHDNNNKIDTSLFVQKPYLRTNYTEANIEENTDLKNQYRIKNLPDPISTSEACSKYYVDTLFSDPSILKNTSHIDLNDRNFTNARFFQVNQLRQIDSHLTTKPWFFKLWYAYHQWYVRKVVVVRRTICKKRCRHFW